MTDQNNDGSRIEVARRDRASIARHAVGRLHEYLAEQADGKRHLRQLILEVPAGTTAAARKSATALTRHPNVLHCGVRKLTRGRSLLLLYRTKFHGITPSREQEIYTDRSFLFQIAERRVQAGSDDLIRKCDLLLSEHAVQRWIGRDEETAFAPADLLRQLDLAGVAILEQIRRLLTSGGTPRSFAICTPAGAWVMERRRWAQEVREKRGSEDKPKRTPFFAATTFYGLPEMNIQRRAYWETAQRNGTRAALRAHPDAFPANGPLAENVEKEILRLDQEAQCAKD